MSRLVFSILLALAAAVTRVEAWWCLGHMVIAEIARQNLNDGVESKVNEQFDFLNKFFPQSNDMISGACWADDLKSQGLEVMASWHFINQPYNPQNITIAKWPIQEVNVATAITSLDETEAPWQQSKNNQWINAFAVANLVHFLGDIHQPLHATELFDADFPTGDEGGNLFHVTWQGKKWPLHFIWDSICAQYTTEPQRPLNNTEHNFIKNLASEFMQNFSVPADQRTVYNSTIMAEESFAYAVRFAYVNNTLKPGQALTQQYMDICKIAAGHRIAYAGYRLANELNYIYSDDSRGITGEAILKRLAHARREHEKMVGKKHAENNFMPNIFGGRK